MRRIDRGWAVLHLALLGGIILGAFLSGELALVCFVLFSILPGPPSKRAAE